jgi:hypothetical protein
MSAADRPVVVAILAVTAGAIAGATAAATVAVTAVMIVAAVRAAAVVAVLVRALALVEAASAVLAAMAARAEAVASAAAQVVVRVLAVVDAVGPQERSVALVESRLRAERVSARSVRNTTTCRRRPSGAYVCRAVMARQFDSHVVRRWPTLLSGSTSTPPSWSRCCLAWAKW